MTYPSWGPLQFARCSRHARIVAPPGSPECDTAAQASRNRSARFVIQRTQRWPAASDSIRVAIPAPIVSKDESGAWRRCYRPPASCSCVPSGTRGVGTRQTCDVHSLLGRLGLGTVVITVSLAGCGGPESGLQGVSQARTSTTVATATTLGKPPPTVRATSSTTAATTAVTTSTSTSAGAGTGVNGIVLFSPVCPVERIPPDPQCAPRPGAADIQLVRPNGSVVAEGRAGSDGRFSVPAAPGSYTVRATANPGPGRGCQAEPAQVTVVARSVVSVAVSCDTGIR